jgi:TrmH family RNA methyltransferase
VKALTLARDLRRRKARERQGLFVCEGLRACEELLRSSVQPVAALATAELRATPRGDALAAELEARKLLTEISAAEFASAADTDSPQGVLIVARVPSRSLDDLRRHGPARILALDGVQDPGNTGTILRTAHALGFDATIALPGTVDLWNAKVVRSGMGAQFTHPAISAEWTAFRDFANATDVTLWGADASGEAVESLSPPERLALIVGNEGNGLGTHVRSEVATLVALPIGEAVESLNVAVATGILLYLLRR